ncbi:embryo-specific protein ATS3B-like [Cicer arietinum]|uniref:Embryo-specific protein ATS3B-like n=1 Tax=Cicer arietinum TaxID=3827 RepID=A0A1S3E725_CICAR|nr:embryo-specific protein ATS3B-like [Cicer arietinum]
MKVFTLIFTFSIIVDLLQATPTLITRHTIQTNQSSTLNSVEGEGCNYKITIETSCYSPPSTTDQIDLLFADAHGTEVLVPRLDSIASGMFDQCTTSIFNITAKVCIDKICKVFVYRRGSNGWIPKTITVNDYMHPPLAVYLNASIPNDGLGYGRNLCKLPSNK